FQSGCALARAAATACRPALNPATACGHSSRGGLRARMRATCKTIVAGVLLCATALAGTAPAFADTYIYKDVLRPNGHARGMAAKFADFRACGYRKGASVSDAAVERIGACMRSRGWALDHIVPDPAQRAKAAAAPPARYRKYDPDNGWMMCQEIL